MSTPVPPFVRKLIPCLKVELTGEAPEKQYQLTEPLSVIDQPIQPPDYQITGETSGVDMALFVSLTGGLDSTRVLAEVRHSLDDRIYRRIGGTKPVEVNFTTENRGASTLNLHFNFWNLPMINKGLYEFRMLAIDPENPDKTLELPGERAEIRVLSKTL